MNCEIGRNEGREIEKAEWGTTKEDSIKGEGR